MRSAEGRAPGELTREELEARLTPNDLAILESKIGPDMGPDR